MSSIGLVLEGAASLSVIVTVTVDGEPSENPVAVGFNRLTVKVSFPSTSTSFVMNTSIVFDVSPVANVSTPLAVL